MKNLREIVIRPKEGGDFEIEGSWSDTKNKAKILIGGDPAQISINRLILLVEATREAGDEELHRAR